MCEEIAEAATDPLKATQKRVHFVGLDDRQIEWSARRGQLHRKILRDQRRHYKQFIKELDKRQKEKSADSVSMAELPTINEEELLYFLCEAHNSIHNPFGVDESEKETVSTLPIASFVLQQASTCEGLKEVVTKKTSINDLPRILLENIHHWDSDFRMDVKFWMESSLAKKIITLKEKKPMVEHSLKCVFDLLPSADNESSSQILIGLSKLRTKRPTVESAKRAAVALKIGIENINTDSNAHFSQRVISLHWLNKIDKMDEEELISVLRDVAPRLNGHLSGSPDEDDDNDNGNK